MDQLRTINRLNYVVALVLAAIVAFSQSFGRGCLYAVLFFVGALVIQMILSSCSNAHEDSAVDRLMLTAGEPPTYMKRNIAMATCLQVTLNVLLACWMFSQAR